MDESLFEPRHVVRTNSYGMDPAIDLSKTNLFAYQLTRSKAELVLRPDAKADWFVIQRLTPRYSSRLLHGITNDAERFEHAFLYSCHEVTLANDEKLRPGNIKETALSGVRRAADEWIDEIANRWGMATVLEMGAIACDLTQLPPGASGPFVSRATWAAGR